MGGRRVAVGLGIAHLSRWLVGAALVAVIASGSGMVAAPAFAASELTRRATWSQPSIDEVRAQLDAWLEARQVPESDRQTLRADWDAAVKLGSPDVLQLVAQSIARVEEPAKKLVEFVTATRAAALVPPFEALQQDQLLPFARNNLRLWWGRWLVEQSLFDEGLEQIENLQPADVVDPISLLFLQSVCYHQLLNTEKFTPVIQRLLENEKQLPQRYLTVAKLMQADLAPLKPDTLDEVSRLMNDIRRRLSLGRAGTRVRQVEDDVIAKLDKMIKQMEDQQKQQQQSAGSAGAQAPQSPAPDSQLPGGGGPGNVDPKKLSREGGWGNLPPKERQEALQQIGKELPAHYREVIEEYFRKLAREGGK